MRLLLKDLQTRCFLGNPPHPEVEGERRCEVDRGDEGKKPPSTEGETIGKWFEDIDRSNPEVTLTTFYRMLGLVKIELEHPILDVDMTARLNKQRMTN